MLFKEGGVDVTRVLEHPWGSQCDLGWPVSWKGQLMLAIDMDRTPTGL